jgi:cobalt/nickel transport protein
MKPRLSRCPHPVALALSLGLVLSGPFTTRAHFPMLIHDTPLGATNGPVTVTFAIGHPFELDFEPARRPDQLLWIDASGRQTNVTGQLKATLFRNDTNAAGWQIVLHPSTGDHVLALDSAPTVNERQKTLYREFVKVWIHRARQGAWHQRTGQPLEIVPLTRPYGIRPGMVFGGQLLRGNQPVADTEIYAERLNEHPPEAGALPPEPLITFAVRTDSEGRFFFSPPDPGWWVVGAYVDDLGPVLHQDQRFTLEGFAGAWIRIEPDP